MSIISFVGIDRFRHAKVDDRLLREIDWQWVELLLLCLHIFVNINAL